MNDADSNDPKQSGKDSGNTKRAPASKSSTLALPKSGGAIRGIGEKFGANPVTGAGSMSVPVATSPGRCGFGPQLSLSYNSGSGNSPFGFGCGLSLPKITRKTDMGLPGYADADDSDVFILAGVEDLVPLMTQDSLGNWSPHIEPDRTVNGTDYALRLYRPRIEGAYTRIEKWSNRSDDSDVFWRCISASNVTSWFGKSAESRIADVNNPRKIFSWLISENYDDKGNVIVYGYKPEDSTNINLDVSGNPVSRVCERNRTTAGRSVQRYLKYIRYSSVAPYYPQLSPQAAWPQAPDADAVDGSNSWLFEVVFDYGEHDLTNPLPTDDNGWAVRPDPYSEYRPGFEVRTYRKCQRVLMFHHFPDEAGVNRNCLVRSTDLTYSDNINPADSSNPIYSFLIKVGLTGYRRQVDGAGYTSLSMPPVEMTYSTAVIQAQVEDVPSGALENLPTGMFGQDGHQKGGEPAYRWVDLHGEGIPGILTEQGGEWHYKRNLSPIPQIQADGSEIVTAQFAPSELVATRPNVSLTAGAQIVDLGADGQPEVMVLSGPTPGYYAHDDAESWEPFVPFESRINRDLGDPNTRLIDLDGDGLPDVLITEDTALVWHPSLGRIGFAASIRVDKSVDEETGPRVVFADGTETIFLADMSGDGLTDIVRIRNSDICYWPNLGYGRFGAKVTMDSAPTFDLPERFDPHCLRLADIDGSGTTDIIYLRDGGVQIAFNQSGNGWSQVQTLPIFPRVDDLSDVTICDLLGNGTACLVWSSCLPADAGRPMRYVNLMGTQKPHLLIKSINNLGAETQVTYAPSTMFYLQDKRAGQPWITRLPFPVHVVEQVESFDHVSETRFVTRYAYHHGYYDRPEREFRGFGMVEQWDTEAYEDYVEGVPHTENGQTLAPELYQPVVTTRTWFHTGAYLEGGTIFSQYESEYFQNRALLTAPQMPAGLDVVSLVECVRALKGLQLRQEVYSFDGTANQNIPYGVTETNYELRQLQPHIGDDYGVFQVMQRESISLNLERNAADPRVAHRLVLETDQYGNAVHACSVVYGRQIADLSLPASVTADQQKIWITYSENDFTPDLLTTAAVDVYRLRTVCEARAYEITGISPASTWFALDEIKSLIDVAAPIDYEVVADGTSNQKRLLSQSRVLFQDNAFNPLPLGQWDSLALAYQSYALAFTPNVITTQYAGGVDASDLSAAGYVHFAGDSNWWTPSGTAIYPINPAASFYLPTGATDALGLASATTYDAYSLLVNQVSMPSAAWNVSTALNDYRVLGAVQMTDANGNRVAVEQDELGIVVKTAVMGKAGSSDGDTLSDPTTRVEYDAFNWMNNGLPSYVHTFAREQHGAANPRWQESYSYSNGAGGVAMVKAQANPGDAYTVQPDGTVIQVNANPRWIGNGRTIVNNKGNPVKQYEPYFSTTSDYEDEKSLVQIGVTPLFYYDPLGRNVRTDYPNGTLTSATFTAWMQSHYDANDNVLQSQWYADRGSPDPTTSPEPQNDPETRAAWLAAKHANTPSVLHSNSLARTIYAISDYGAGVTAGLRSESDFGDRNMLFFDQMGRQFASGFKGMSGAAIYGISAEKGQRWTFQNVLGALVKTWDQFGRQFRMEYDSLHRPFATYVKPTGQSEILFNYVVYGDRLALADAQAQNLLGASYLIYDQGGMVQMAQLDFKGNPLSIIRTLASDYKADRDWSTLYGQPDVTSVISAGNALLDIPDTFSASATYDALDRPTQLVFPDATIVVPTYDESNQLASVQAQIRGIGAMTQFLQEQDYDAKGQRLYAKYGNSLITSYLYDVNTFRLINLVTAPQGANPLTQALQNLTYCYDPVCNITQNNDAAQQTNFFNNAVVAPQNLYEYDALYQLVLASGRELAGGINDTVLTSTDLDALSLPQANDLGAVRNYTESYQYDLLGNIRVMKHNFQSQAGVGGGWTRHYQYAVDTAPGDCTNRLTATSQPGDPDAGPYSGTYSYDNYGNMTSMPNLATMDWNFMDQLRQVDLGGGGTAYYVYGLDGQRLRKVIERNGNLKMEWIFLGAVMIFRRRRRDTNALRMERWTVHISDNTGVIAQVDTKTLDEDNDDPANPLNVALIRYQYANHLGSAVLETDENGNPISYEEYHPFGTTSYRSAKPGFDLSLKRYRFSGKERDDETGLYYIGARYYACWLGRWTSSDPAGFAEGPNLFAYCRNNPVGRTDPKGTDSNDVGIGKPPEDILKALKTDSPDARKKLEAWYGDHAFASPSDPNQFLMLRPGSLAWNEEKKQNWGIFDPIQTDEVVVNGKDPEPKAGPHGNVGSAVTTHDSVLRGNYEKADRQNSAAAQDAIAEAKKSGDSGAALAEAEKASGLRNQGRIETQNRVSPPGKWISQKIEGERGFEKMKATYSKRLPSSEAKKLPKGAPKGGGPPADDFELARRIAVASGEPRWYMSWAGKAGRVLGPAGMLLSGYALGNDIYNHDWSMAAGDALNVGGSGLETYALFNGGAAATVLGVSAVNLGLVVGGVGIAVTSGISAYRAFKSGDNVTGVVDSVGVVAGAAITVGAGILLASAAGVAVGAGLLAAAPVIIGVGLVAAAGVGLYHLGGWLKNKLF